MKKFFPCPIPLAAVLCTSLLISCSSDLEMPPPPLKDKYSSSSPAELSSSSSDGVSSSSVDISSSSSLVGLSSSSDGFLSSSSSSFVEFSSSSLEVSSSSNSSSSVGVSSSSSIEISSSSVASSSSSVASSSSAVSSSSLTQSSSSSVPPSSSSVVTGTGLCAGFVTGTKREHYGKEKEQFCDERDGKKYVYVTIGAQTWMAENLNYNATGSKCYSNNEANCAIYGRLYNWVTAMDIASTYSSSLYSVSGKHKGICPSGWHIQTNAEWSELIRYVDGTSDTSSSYVSLTAGKYLKATSGWNNNWNGIDTYGFTALPGGDCNSGGGFARVGYHGLYWNTTEKNATSAYRPGFWQSDTGHTTATEIKPWLLSVRCLKD